MNMKFLASLMAVMLVAGMMVGCGSKSPEAVNSAEQTEEAVATDALNAAEQSVDAAGEAAEHAVGEAKEAVADAEAAVKDEHAAEAPAADAHAEHH